ncbi:MAG TPA: Gfo/Idh/MocA family oxidoreductase, partial [Solirubrobacterales bacterium]|nr:Gfo/Idh/MocA family oxidoreductase [Solirubrobacterales bacterium]
MSGRGDFYDHVTAKSPQPLRLGIVGSGRIVERGYLPALDGSAAWMLTALADPELSRAQRLAEACGAAAYPSSEEMLASGDVDAIVVATPAHLHVQVADAAATAGIPSLVEKPPAPHVHGAIA